MSDKKESATVEQRLQVLDVGVVDVLSHLEALLRQSHTIQRSLLQLRSEAPPPAPEMPQHVISGLRTHAEYMRREWAMLGDIIDDLTIGIHHLGGSQDFPERRNGRDRRENVRAEGDAGSHI